MNSLPDLTKAILSDRELVKTADRLIDIALKRGPAMSRKAAVSAVGTGDITALVTDPDAQPLVNIVQRRSVAGRLQGLGAVGVPPDRLLPASGADPVPHWAGEGLPAPLARLTTTTTFTGRHSYILLLAVMADVLKFADTRARNLILSVSLRALVNGDDRVFLGDDAASAGQPAGLLWNRAAVGAGSPSDLQADLEQLYAETSDGAPTSPVFVLSGRAALYLSATGLQAFKNLGVMGGTIAGAPALISKAAGSNLILIDAPEIAISDSGLETFSSNAASIQMDDSPTPGSSSLVSAFQTDTVVLKYVRFLSWTLLRADAVQYLTLPIGGSPA